MLGTFLLGIFAALVYVADPSNQAAPEDDKSRIPLVNPQDSNPTRSQKLYALALSAYYTEYNKGSHYDLGVNARTPENTEKILSGLARGWSIFNRNDLLDSLGWLETGGHRAGFNEIVHWLDDADPEARAQNLHLADADEKTSNRVAFVMSHKDALNGKSIDAWDFARYVNLCRWGYHTGFLTEGEAWGLIMPIARDIQTTYASWDEYGRAFLVGREFWSPKEMIKSGPYSRRIHTRLVTEPDSPWMRIAWNTDLTPQPRAYEIAKLKAEAGDSHAMYDLAQMLEYGDCTDRNIGEAIHWYEKASENKNIEAMKRLVWLYGESPDLPRDKAKARHWTEQAADCGDALSQYQLSNAYYYGNDGAPDMTNAAIWAEKAAENGNSDAQYRLAYLYYRGMGVETNIEKNVYWKTRAAEQGHVNAQYDLGQIYKTSDKIPHDFVKSAYWYRKAAEQGHRQAQMRLASMLWDGIGVEKNASEAWMWHEKACQNGDAESQYILGCAYADGNHLEVDNVKAVYWLTQSAKQGYADAQYRLGNLYRDGKGVEQSTVAATAFYKQAIQQGHRLAETELKKLEATKIPND